MSKTDPKQPVKREMKTSRERIAWRILQHFPDRCFETMDDVYDAIDEYETFVCNRYEKLLEAQNELNDQMQNNPATSTFVSDVADEKITDPDHSLREIEKTIKENVKKSTRSIEQFMRDKKMSDEELENFIERICDVCNHVFTGDLCEDILELLYKGLRYDNDLVCAEQAGEVKGRNHRIVMERRDATGDTIPALRNTGSPSDEKSRRPRRPGSVWDM